jgi:hypothetical protein
MLQSPKPKRWLNHTATGLTLNDCNSWTIPELPDLANDHTGKLNMGMAKEIREMKKHTAYNPRIKHGMIKDIPHFLLI